MANALSHRHTSLAAPLAWVYGALILYASLFPFTGWRWPPGQSLLALLALPWPPWRDAFDMWANFLGYLPGGVLLFLGLHARGMRGGAALGVVLGVGLALSFGNEFTQNFLPGRHPSLKDLAMNLAGAMCGALLAWAFSAVETPTRWAATRARWFVPRSGGALALLALWPIGLLFPAPLPFGLGQLGERLRETIAAALHGVPWAASWYEMVATPTVSTAPLRPLSEGMATALALFAPIMLAYGVARPGWRRALLVIILAIVAFGAMTLSTALNFGPLHALGWLTPVTVPAMAASCVVALALIAAPCRVAAALALAALAGAVALVAQAPSDPYFAQSLQSWEQGRFIHFHGMAQWVGWLWPYVAMLWLLGQLARRE